MKPKQLAQKEDKIAGDLLRDIETALEAKKPDAIHNYERFINAVSTRRGMAQFITSATQNV